MRTVSALFVAVLATAVAMAQTTGLKVTVRSRFDTVGPWGGLMMSANGGGANGCKSAVTVMGSRLVMDYSAADRGCPGGFWIVDFSEERTYRLRPDTQD